MSFKFKMQGDVTFNKFDGELSGTKQKHNGSFVLALGEKTGHRHLITVDRPDQMEVRDIGNGEFILVLSSAATITHEEHLPITLDPGTYRVGKEREFDNFSLVTRQVVD